MTKLQQLQTIIGLIILFSFSLFLAVVFGIIGIFLLSCDFIVKVIKDIANMPTQLWSDITNHFNSKANA